jgi:pyruvate ferredoxin oxidoreductase gamma subunit
VNSHQTAATWRHRLNLDARLLILPAGSEVEDRAELPQIGATCAGAAACLLGVIERQVLAQAIAEELAGLGPDIVTQNRAGALTAYDAVADLLGTVEEGASIAADRYQAPEWIELPFDDASLSAPTIRAAANSVQVRTGLWRTIRPVIDYDYCKHCWWVCSTLCPDSAIAVNADIPVIDYDHCKGCMICVSVCPPHAIGGIPEYLAQQQEDGEAAAGGADGADTANR